MKKEEFINKLRKKISILDQKEIDDIISEYEGYIEEKMNEGMSEEEAVKAIGNINEIADDLLSAYKINSNYNSGKNIISSIIDKFVSFVDLIIKIFDTKGPKEFFKIFIKTVLLLIIIRILKLPIDILLDFTKDTFLELGYTVGMYVFKVLTIFVNIIYVILAVMLFVKVFKEKIIGEDLIEETKKQDVKKNDSKKNNNEKKINEVKEEKKNKNFIDFLADIALIFIKFLVAMISIGNIFFIAGLSTAFVILIYFIIKGVTYFGPIIIVFALLLFSIAFLELFIRFIFDCKQHIVKFIVILVTSLIIGGAGIGVMSIEIANTEIVYKDENPNAQTIIKNIKMSDDLSFDNYLAKEYIIDETLQDEVKIEYKYNNDFLDFEPNISIDEDENCVTFEFNENWNKKSLNKIIKQLKRKKIYIYDNPIEIKIYSSNSNIEKIKENSKANIEKDFDEDYYWED